MVMHNLDVWQMAPHKEREIDLKRCERESRNLQALDERSTRPIPWSGMDTFGRVWRGIRATPRMRWRWPEIPQRVGEARVGVMALAECHEG